MGKEFDFACEWANGNNLLEWIWSNEDKNSVNNEEIIEEERRLEREMEEEEWTEDTGESAGMGAGDKEIDENAGYTRGE